MVVNFQRVPNTKLFLERQEQATSSFHLGWKHYLQITWKTARSVRAVGNRWENQHHFKVLVSYECSYVGLPPEIVLVVVKGRVCVK